MKQVQGMSLVELLVAMGLSTVLLLGVLQIFLTNKKTSLLQNGLNQIQESGRIAAELMAKDIRLSGHWGCAGSLKKVKTQLNYTDQVVNMAPLGPSDMRKNITVEDNIGQKRVGSIVVKEGSDTLTLRGAQQIHGANLEHAMATNTSDLQITPGTSLKQDQVLLISDCETADIFSVSNYSINTGIIQHGTKGKQVTNKVPSLSKPYKVNAQLYTLFTRYYFVGKNAQGSDSLYLKENDQPASEVVRNIDNLQLRLGIDTNYDGSVDHITNKISSTAYQDNILTVELAISAISPTTTGSKGQALTRQYRLITYSRNQGVRW